MTKSPWQEEEDMLKRNCDGFDEIHELFDELIYFSNEIFIKAASHIALLKWLSINGQNV